MSTHFTEDELTLYYYGEGRYQTNRPGDKGPRSEVVRHLDACAPCAALYREITRTLALVTAPETPERDDQYGLEVWQRIRHQLPERDTPGWMTLVTLRADRLVLAGAAAALILVAFVAGRMWPRATPVAPPGTTSTTSATTVAADAGSAAAAGNDVRHRILLTSVADHLDRSERVLTDIMNAPSRGDISTEQGWADDLLTTSRLYRQDAVEAGESAIAAVLDELERSLLEIVHSPSPIAAADLEQIRRRIDAAALLFKVRVMSDELRQRDSAPAPRATTQKTS
ncbi:MAG: hypothetical protein HY048_08355 [Acidobacteria bacterium]|nr:hypothetical protein [Acidobacteriota bacterium]